MVPLSKQDLTPSCSMRLSMLSKGYSRSLAIDAQSQCRCTSSSGSLSRAARAVAALELAGTHASRDEDEAAADAWARLCSRAASSCACSSCCFCVAWLSSACSLRLAPSSFACARALSASRLLLWRTRRRTSKKAAIRTRPVEVVRIVKQCRRT